MSDFDVDSLLQQISDMYGSDGEDGVANTVQEQQRPEAIRADHASSASPLASADAGIVLGTVASEASADQSNRTSRSFGDLTGQQQTSGSMKEVARSAGRIAGQAAEAAESLTSETSDGTRSEGVAGFGQLAVPSREGQMLSLQDLGAGASLERSVLSPISSDQAASHGGTEIGRGHVERPIGGYIAKAPEEEGTPKVLSLEDFAELRSKLESVEMQVEVSKRRAMEVGQDLDSLLAKLFEVEEQAEQRHRAQAKELREVKQREEQAIEDHIALQNMLEHQEASKARSQSLERELQEAQHRQCSEERAQQAVAAELAFAEEALERQGHELSRTRLELQAAGEQDAGTRYHAESCCLRQASPSPVDEDYTNRLTKAVPKPAQPLPGVAAHQQSLRSLREQHLKLLRSRLRDCRLREYVRDNSDSAVNTTRLLNELMIWQDRWQDEARAASRALTGCMRLEPVEHGRKRAPCSQSSTGFAEVRATLHSLASSNMEPSPPDRIVFAAEALRRALLPKGV